METTGIMPTLPLGSDGFGMGNSGIWLFAILALMFGGFGRNGWNNADGRIATVEDLNNSTNFTRLENQVRDNANLTERKTDAIVNGICDLGYKLAADSAATNQLIVAEAQKTRDLITQNKIEALQSKINQLELSQAMSGVVRYPNGYTYCAGQSPFCGCNNAQTI